MTRSQIRALADAVQGERFVWGTVIGKNNISPCSWGSVVPGERSFNLLVKVDGTGEEVIVPVSQSQYESAQFHDQVPIQD